MPRPSVIPDVLLRLEAYLNEREVAYWSQPEGNRDPTIPSTPDGKVNVRVLAAAIGLRQTQEKYLYSNADLSNLINLMAEGQGLLPIRARLLQQAGDKVLQARLVRQAKDSRAASQAVVEAQAAQSELLEKLRDAVAEIERLQAANLRLRAQLDAMDAGLHIRIAD